MTSTLWFTYGMMTDQPPLIRVNSIGIVLEIAYSAVFFTVARTNKNAKILVGALAFTFSVLALTYIVEPPGTFMKTNIKIIFLHFFRIIQNFFLL